MGSILNNCVKEAEALRDVLTKLAAGPEADRVERIGKQLLVLRRRSVY